MSAAAAFPISTPVWVKQQDYPWWPGVIIDPAASGVEMPAECDVCVMCYPTTAPTAACVNSANAAEICLFGGKEADAEMIEAGMANPDCAAAVVEALQTHNANYEQQQQQTGEVVFDDLKAPMAAFDATQDEQDITTDTFKREKRHRSEKKDKKKKKDKKSKQDKKKSKKRSRSERSDSDDSDGSGLADDFHDDSDGNDGNDDGIVFAKDRSQSKRARAQRQSNLDEYDRNHGEHSSARSVGGGYVPRIDADYFYRKCQQSRRAATKEELLTCGAQLKTIQSECMRDSSYEEKEQELLAVLRVLTAYDVTLAQLQSTSIGVIVGQLLRESFTYPVRELTKATLTYWFHTLPKAAQQDIVENNELDRCSVESTAGARSDEDADDAADNEANAALGPVGLHILEAFTDEEIYDAPANVDVIEISRNIEEALKDRDRDTRATVLSALIDTTNSGVRRAILDGKISAKAVVDGANDLPALLASTRGGGLRLFMTMDSSMGGSVGSPTTPFSPTGPSDAGFSSPIGRSSMGNITTAYTCPNCGAQEAFRSGYTVSAHDNFPDILRCRKCDSTWNIADQ